jgi:ribosomal protein L11 methyltransferase
VEFEESLYLIPEEIEPELYEQLLAIEFHNFYIERLKGKQPLVKVYFLPSEDSSKVKKLIESYGAECVGVQKLEEVDWLKKWMDTLDCFELTPTVWVNPFPEKEFVKEGMDVLNIVPGTAFGTGLHATTKLAANLMERLPIQGKQVLDVGCGTGILALMAKIKGADRLVAMDEDPLAVEKTNIIFEMNHQSGVTALQSDLLKAWDDKKPFDLIVANIIFEILDMLLDDPKLKNLCHADTRLVFSGVSDEKLPRMLDSFKAKGLEVLQHSKQTPWNGFILRFKQF